MSKTRLAAAKRLVVKVGSALVTNNGAGLDLAAIDDWARQISVLRSQGKQVVLVSSGAIACGMQRLGWQKRPPAIHAPTSAACASPSAACRRRWRLTRPARPPCPARAGR